ncbi:MAG: 3-deoxy-7-phosphoheptulonate synthase [Planctomycetota bacterium]
MTSEPTDVTMSGTSNKLLVERANSPEWKDCLRTRPVRVGSVSVGGNRPVMIAGPCAVESREQTLEIADQVLAAGADMLRGGAFKPRTNPHCFQGLGEKGLEILAEARERTGLPVVTEVMDPRLVEMVARYADVLQIGSRSMQNYPLLIEVGKAGKPVLLKRGFSATLEEWLGSAEYIALQGNLDIILCERGIRTFSMDEYSRNTLDLNVIPALRGKTFLPVIADPSHATGDARFVLPAGLAAIAAGAVGLIVETIGESTPRSEILCDQKQGIRPDQLRRLVAQVHALGGDQFEDPRRLPEGPR